MTAQLTWLAIALVLAVVHIFVTAAFKRRQDGMAWAAGSRDAPRQYSGVAARLDRAERNLWETLWIFGFALLIAHVAGRDGAVNLWGARVYVLARIAYVPLYASGVRMVRSLAFGVSIWGLVMTLAAILVPMR